MSPFYSSLWFAFLPATLALSSRMTTTGHAPPPRTIDTVSKAPIKFEISKEKMKTFGDLFATDGLQVVKNTDVPSNYDSINVGLPFPDDWNPTESYVWSSTESLAVESQLRSVLMDAGVFDKYPDMERKFDQTDVHLYGGRCRLQPGDFSGMYLTHLFITTFALWDDIIEEDVDFGLASCGRLRRLLQVRREDPSAVNAILSEDPRDESFMVCWEQLFVHIDDACDTMSSLDSLTFYKRFRNSFLIWLDAVEKEMEHLCLVEPSEIDIEKEWTNRISSVGTIVFFEFLLYGAGFTPSDELYSGLQDICWFYSKAVREVNEIASIPKDIIDDCGSVFTSTMIVNQFSCQETLDHFINRFDESIKKFDEKAALLLSLQESEKERKDLEKFLNAVRYSTVGLYDWHFPNTEGKRYNRVKLINPSSDEVFNFCSNMGMRTSEVKVTAE